MKHLEERAKKIIGEGEYIEKTGSGIWENFFYNFNGNLVNLQFKGGQLFDIINYGR